MPSLFKRKTTASAAKPAEPSPPPADFSSAAHLQQPSAAEARASGESVRSPSGRSSPEKRSSKSGGGYFGVKERGEGKERRASTRSAKSASAKAKKAEEEHPLNDPRRWSALSAMSSPPRERSSSPLNGGGVGLNSDRMDLSTPAPETPGPASRTTNGVNGEHHEDEDGEAEAEAEAESVPAPPPHRTPTSPPPQPEKSATEEAEAFKAQGNKFYKAGQYGKAIDEYTQGGSIFVKQLVA
jgi:DnaJ homolog subfamily C member 7